jgi:D-alanine-D-alanine ligase
VVANAISLDKTQTKRVWQQTGLPTAPFREFHSVEQLLNADFSGLQYPLFVKPAREGSGMGVAAASLVEGYETLVQRVTWALLTYQQPILVEEYLPGREFTVGFIGNPGYVNSRNSPVFYDAEGYHWFPVLEIDTDHSVSPGIYGHSAKDLTIESAGAPAYLCPADIPVMLKAQLVALAKRAAQAIGTCDVGRVDFRLDGHGKPRLLEINTLPGLNPVLSDLCIMAAAGGLAYDVLIKEILYLAADRFGLSLVPAVRPVRSKSFSANGKVAVTAKAVVETAY